ncbi:unnamed protein product [Camellia sinensis]
MVCITDECIAKHGKEIVWVGSQQLGMALEQGDLFANADQRVEIVPSIDKRFLL